MSEPSQGTRVELPDFAVQRQLIDAAWQGARALPPVFSPELAHAVERVMQALDGGHVRAAEPATNEPDRWQVNTWVLRAVALWHAVMPCEEGLFGFAPSFAERNLLKFSGWDRERWKASGLRVYPRAVVRFSAHLARGVRVLPSYVGPGAFIDEGSAVDGCVNVGSCAQIGKRVHLGAGVTLGGVLEPLQERPVIIEDDCFIGANSSIVEGVLVESGSVIAPGVHLSASTKIFDRATREISYGRVPPSSVVVPGSLPSDDGSHCVACAVIVKRADAGTRDRTGLTTLLRS